MRKPIIAGNWKMYKTIREAKEFAEKITAANLDPQVEAIICAPYTAIRELVTSLDSTSVGVGAQNFHYEDKGAFTGEISASMLLEIGARYVIIGHSERRQYFNETDETVNLKTKKALEAGLVPIVCVGESLAQREHDETESVIKVQVEKALKDISKEDISKVVIAYEPIWAIGTGKTATSEQANEVCRSIRTTIADLFGKEQSEKIRIQYGGSVKTSNIKEIMAQPDIDGALIGGAALVAEDFVQLVNY
ncbi:MAG: triose-phosphate isomerase [Peptostreptococcaceae bacterium]|nr:triose-phosphate isomerase [Peptostreptococcaceae bacterium]